MIETGVISRLDANDSFSETECSGMASLPRIIAHPVGERDAAVFHAILAGIGLLHIIGGVAMIFFHGVSSIRHARDA